jgi:hypothetical protein
MAALTPMKRDAREYNRPRRAAAFLLAFLCLWMATIGLSHHTDLLFDQGSSSPQTVISHSVAFDDSDDLCAACQWTQMVQPGSVLFPVLVVTLVTLPQAALTAADVPFRRVSRPSSPRAPPASLLPKHSYFAA